MYKLYQVHNILEKYKLPPYVKKATWGEICAQEENIPTHLFADDKARKYPCHTPAATVISAAQFNEDKTNYSQARQQYIESRLKKHAEELKILPDVEDILQHKPEQQEVFALEYEGRLFFPIRNEKEIKKLAEYLVEHYRDIPQEQREEAARNALKEAELQDYALGEVKNTLEKLACIGIVDKKAFLDVLTVAMQRVSPTSIQKNKSHEMLVQLTNAVIDIPPGQQTTLMKAVKAASDLVAEIINIRKPLELEVIYTISELKKEADSVIRLATGSYYRKEDLLKTPTYVLKEAFDNYGMPIEINGIISHHRLFKAIKALDEIQAQNFEDRLQECNIYPVVCEAKADSIPA